MKLIKLFVAVVFITSALIMPARAKEIRTLVSQGDPIEINLNPADLIELENVKVNTPGVGPLVILTFETGTFRMTGNTSSGIYTGLTKLRFENEGAARGPMLLTLKITPASEINAAGPTSILVLPENAEGNYDLTVESSSDMVTWTPIHSQSVQSNTTSRMFRVRIAKK